ncbi:DUF1990 domain-containing protein [Streptomyces sp. NPDC089919]|uniref:DUF1990 family protein n=1 Tax=Streptomyces sp. NPDC089919 TaxID=3155188 RepID=UPI00343AEB81
MNPQPRPATDTAPGFSPDPDSLSYPERAATLHRPLPAGYNHLHHRTRIGTGRAAFERAGTAVTTFAMHRAAGLRVRAAGPRAEPGIRLGNALGVGRFEISVPCEVVWTAYESDLTGFAYGTRPGHPEQGEESFLVELDAQGAVWFTVTAFSRPATWYTRLAGPLVPFLQMRFARLCGRRLRRIAAG